MERIKRYGQGKSEKRLASVFVERNEKKLITDYFTLHKDIVPDTFCINTNGTQSALVAAREQQEPAIKKSQTYLDLGQKNLMFKECLECGMRYDPSFHSEERLHMRFHRFHTTGMLIKYHQSEIIGRYVNYVIVSVNGQKREEVIELVNNELNAVDLVGKERVFALLDVDKRLCSVLIIEPDYTVLKVSRIWTMKDLRRKGLATVLLKKISSHLNTSEVEFSAPTDAGMAFAQHYTKSAVKLYKI